MTKTKKVNDNIDIDQSALKDNYVKVKALVMMQLKNKLNLNFLKSKKQAFLRISLMVLGFILLTAVIYLLFYLASVFRLFSFGTLVPVSVLVVVFSLMLVLSIITCTFGMMKALYFSKDNQVLLTFPVSRTKIFVSKFIVFYINELIKSVTFILPLFIAFGLVNHLPIYFYVWLLFCLFIIALIPVALGALLSIPLMAITIVLKKNRIVEIIFTVIAIALITFVVVEIIKAIPADINIVGSWGTLFWDIQSFLQSFSQIFYPFTVLTEMVVGTVINMTPHVFTINTLIYLVSYLGTLAVILTLALFISRPLFFKMASKPFEYQKKDIKKQIKNHKYSTILSGIHKEILDLFRNSNKAYNLLFVFLIIPIAILLLNKVYSAMSIRLIGSYMTIAFNILIMLLLALSSSTNLSKAYSEEGNSHYIYKVSPKQYYQLLIPKIIVNGVVVIISLIIAVSILCAFINISVGNAILLTLFILFAYIGHLFWSAEFDIMNPQFEQYQTTGNNFNNKNENKSVISAFAISFIVAGVAYFFMVENVNSMYYKVLIFATIFVIYRLVLFFKKVNLYYINPYNKEVHK